MALESKTIRLREIRDEDIDFVVALRNDLGTQAWSRTLPPDTTRSMYEKRYHDKEFSFDRTDGHFVIALTKTDQPIGYAAYSGLKDRHEVMIGLAVARTHWGKGYATLACDLLLGFLFDEAGVQVVRWWTTSDNEGSVALARKLGFVDGVRLRNGIFRGGQFADNLQLDLLRSEWYERQPDRSDGMSV